jgi:4-hydroxy-2-oxoheptanedioate aldolase
MRTLLAEGRTVLNGWSLLPGGFLAEVIASLGWDSLTVDAQHGRTENDSHLTVCDRTMPAR